MKPLTIHSTPEEIQAHKTQETTGAVQNLHGAVNNLHQTALNQATGQDVQNSSDAIAGRLDDLTSVTADNHPGEVVSKIGDTNKQLSSLEQRFQKNAEENQQLLKAISNQIKQKSLPVELLGMEQIIVQGEKGDKGDTGNVHVDGILHLKGNKGDKGEKGDKGDTGYSPVKGVDYNQDGIDGLQGEQGIQGERGEQGTKGDKGLKGDKGENGIDGNTITADEITEKINSKFNHIDFRTLNNIPDFALSKDMQGNGGGGGGMNTRYRNSTGAVISAYVTDIQYGTGITPTYSDGKITLQSASSIQTYTPSIGGTATLDLSLSNVHHITMPAGNVTIAISGGTAGQCFIVRILQDSIGSRTVTWFSTIKWAGGSAPTLTTTASKADTMGFEITGTNTYDGFVVGQNI